MTRIAHLMTHYPHPSHSFLRDEVLGLRSEGLHVETIALNPPDERHVLTDVDRDERRRTWYVKAVSPREVVVTMASLAARHPWTLVRFVVWAVLTGRPDPVVMARRAAQAVEAVLVLAHCRRADVSHLHAHFAGAPGTVAWFTAEVARRTEPHRRFTWSLTVHGPHDFMNERSANLAALVAHADLVVAISDYTAAQLLRHTPPERRDRVHVVRCGIDLDLFAFAPRDRSEHPDRPTCITTVGRMAPEKGQWVLLDAVAELVARGHDVEVRIIGDGELREDIERQIVECGLDGRVRLLGLLDPPSVRSEVAAADVFCLPSFAEGLPIALMEAAAVGTPIVTTAVAGIPELVIDGQTGRCVPAGSAPALAAAIEHVMVDRVESSKMIEAARQAVDERHDRRATSRRLATLFRTVAGDDATGDTSTGEAP